MHMITSDKKVVEITGIQNVNAAGQGGLLDVQIDKTFNEDRWVYYSYSTRIGLQMTTQVSRAKLVDNALFGHQILFTAKKSNANNHHFGCRLVLQDEYLYISIGDRGIMDMAQLLDNHQGKIIRIYKDGSIPEDNPFFQNADAEKEIWSYGHRNPQGLCLNPADNSLWSHEHGPRGGDEINIVEKGLNYGWPEITYGIDYDGSIISEHTHKDGMEQPVTYWDPSIAPCGMCFVSGNNYRNWKNNIFVGGLASRSLHRVELNANEYLNEEVLLEDIGRVRNVAFSPQGFLYIAIESPGCILRIVPTE